MFSLSRAVENFRRYLLVRTDILQKTVDGWKWTWILHASLNFSTKETPFVLVKFLSFTWILDIKETQRFHIYARLVTFALVTNLRWQKAQTSACPFLGKISNFFLPQFWSLAFLFFANNLEGLLPWCNVYHHHRLVDLTYLDLWHLAKTRNTVNLKAVTDRFLVPPMTREHKHENK